MKLNTKSLAGVEYGFVVLSTGSYAARIKSVDLKPNKDKTGNNCVVVHQVLDRTVTDAHGKVVNNNGNIQFTRWVGMQPGDNYDPDRVIKELAVACGVPEDFDGDLDSSMLVGKVVTVKVAYKEAKDGFAEGNDVKGWLPATDEAKALGANSPF